MRLRGHHLVCLHHFRGEGYSAGFVAALRALLQRAEVLGEAVEVVSGADDLCAACPHLQAGVCRHTEDSEAEAREMDETALSLLALRPGDTTTWAWLKSRLPEVMPVWRAHYCGECQWACPEQPGG
jgi:hypothetical protein